VANKDERAYIDVLFFLNRRTSNSASSFISNQAVSNRRSGLRLQNTRRLTLSPMVRILAGYLLGVFVVVLTETGLLRIDVDRINPNV
jgi:hypothetical protein